MFEIVELIEARACGSQQYRVARNGGARRFFDSGGECSALQNRYCIVPQLARDLGSRGANQKRGSGFGLQWLTQYREIAIFIFAAENYPNATGKRVNGFERCIHARNLLEYAAEDCGTAVDLLSALLRRPDCRNLVLHHRSHRKHGRVPAGVARFGSPRRRYCKPHWAKAASRDLAAEGSPVAAG